jgi:hypothetical protein
MIASVGGSVTVVVRGQTADGLSFAKPTWLFSSEIAKIDRLVPIVAETEQILNRRIFSLKSRAQISDGSGRRCFIMRIKICTCNSTGYDALRESSGSEERSLNGNAA